MTTYLDSLSQPRIKYVFVPSGLYWWNEETESWQVEPNK